MLGAIVYNNVEDVGRLLEKEVFNVPNRHMLRRKLQAVVEYLKFYYCGHVGIDDNFAQNM